MRLMSNPALLGRWKALTEAIDRLSKARSLDDAVEVVRTCARLIADAEGITFVLREGGKVRYVAEDAVSPLWTGQSFPIESCISGIAMLNRQPVIIPDIHADPRVPLSAYLSTFVQSMAMFPVGIGEPVAAIGAYWGETGEIDPGAIRLMSALARSVSAVLETIEVMRIAADEAQAFEIAARG
jgi:GAF domain-containing protein